MTTQRKQFTPEFKTGAFQKNDTLQT